jgi:predicted amidohydrolase YtcJ
MFRQSATLLYMLVACPLAGAAPPPADSILLDGRFLVFQGLERGGATGRPTFAEALAVRGGRIVFVGTGEEARRGFRGPATEVVDLHGRTVLPGIVDGHFHGTRASDCSMGYEGGTIAAALAKLQACLDSPAQARYRGTNVQFYARDFFAEDLQPAGTRLTRWDLDRLSTTRPVQVRNADGHKRWFNSRALANAGVDAHTPVSPGGQIGREQDGRPNGFIADMEIDNWGDVVPVTDEARLDLVRRTIADANRMGITSVFIPGGGEDQVELWTLVQDAGALTLRASLGLSADFVHEVRNADELRQRIDALGDYRRYARGLIAVSSVKIYCDGVMEYPAQTAAMLQPYRVNSGSAGSPQWRPGTVRGPDPACADARTGFVELDRAGWQIHVHAIGDRATREALDNFEAARNANGANDLRHTITHLQAIDVADIPRFAALGVIASMSLQWARRDAYSVDDTEGYLDEQLYARLYPARELWQSGAIVAGGSDYPIDPLRPMVQIETSVDHTGERVPGVYPGALSPAETIPDLLAAIRMHTINAAYQLHMEHEIGSIEVGKYADLIVLSQDPFAVPVEDVSDTQVLQTILGGKVVYEAAAPVLGLTHLTR